MRIAEKPLLFTILAVAVISAGTLVTTFIPLFLPSTQPVHPAIRPYSALEIEGRDIYMREGCNACHTQTVRPLRTEVARYGDYSKPEEFAYDRPFLWGSRRTGPDLARIGGKYPDAWHYRHMADPRGMFPASNMPSYRRLAGTRLDTSLTPRKMAVLGSGAGAAEASREIESFRGKVADPGHPAARVRDAVTDAPLRGQVTEMDALVAYLQKVGSDFKRLEAAGTAVAAELPGETSNPYAGDREAALEGKAIFRDHCRGCHGEEGRGGLGPALGDRDRRWIYGGADADVYTSVSGGRPGGMPSFGGSLGRDRIWKVIAYVRSLGKI